ncbi:hypothetical protein IW148_003505 [Coemansia sp. RSA 1199]|nr:hypothetical protein IW148_003505 [Coemansia sp. RSA 1199]
MVARPFPELASADNSRSASPALNAGRVKAKAKGRGKKHAGKAVDAKADVKADVAKPTPGDNATAGRRKHKPRKPNAGSTPQPGPATEAKAGTPSKAKAEAKTEPSEAKTETKRSSGPRRKNRRRPKKTQVEISPESSRASSAMSGSVASTAPTVHLSQPRMPKSLSTGMLSTATIVAGANGCARVQLGRMDEYQPLPGMGGGPRFVASHVVQQRRSSTGHFAYGDMGLVTPTDLGPRQRSLTSTPQRTGFAPHSAGYSPQTAGYSPHSAGYSPLGAGYIPHSADGMRSRSFSASHQLNASVRIAQPVQPQGYFASRRASVSSGLAVDPDHSIRIPTIMFQRSSSSPLVSQPDGESVAMRRLQDMIASVRAAGKPEHPPTPSHPSARFDSILEEDEDSDEQDVELNRPQSSLCA